MPAVPALIMAGASAAGTYGAGKIGKSAQKNAMQRTPEELALITSQKGLADQMGQQGRQLFSAGVPAVRSTLDYYQSLLSGDRQARMNAVSGEAQDTAEAYSGADRAVSQRLRGGERDQALAENSREKAGQIARLVTGVRPMAAGATGDLGTRLIGAGAGLSGQGASIGANLLGNESQNRQFGVQAGQNAAGDASESFGRLLGMFAPSIMGMKVGGGGSSMLNGTGTAGRITNFRGLLPGAGAVSEVGY